MVSADQAQSIVLHACGQGTSASAGRPRDRFVVASCEASPRGDYWIVHANTEDCILHGRFERCYIGVSAYLVDAATGQLEIVGSAFSWQQVLEDKYDVQDAHGLVYVLEPGFDASDRAALVHLRQKLERSYQEIRLLLSPAHRQWLPRQGPHAMSCHAA